MLTVVLFVLMSLCLTTVVPLDTRAIVPATDASAIITDLYSKYSSAAYSKSCLYTDCPGIESYNQYCTSTCTGIVEQTTTLLNSLDNCINKSSCHIQTTAQLKPFNISIHSGSCHLSAETPKVELVPSGHTVEILGKRKYKVTNKMNFVWSNLNLQCSNRPSDNYPSNTVTSCQKLKIIPSFLCPIKNTLLYIGFHALCWLPCTFKSTSIPTSSSTGNIFSGPLQFTQSVTVIQYYTFSVNNNGLTVQITDGGVAPIKTYSFVFDSKVPVANQSTIQTAIENAFNNGDPNSNEVSVIKILYNGLITTFATGFCPSDLVSHYMCSN